MLRNIMHLSIRRLGKHKILAVISVASLAVGLSAALVVIAFVNDELSYDRFHLDFPNIYRVTEAYHDDTRQVHSAMNHGPLAGLIKGRIAGLRHAVRILPHPAYTSPDKLIKYRESRLIFADSSFFSVFSFTSLSGDLAGAMESPFSVVLTASTALRYFGTTDVAGRVLYYEDERDVYPYYITGVIEDVPQQSHFSFDLVFNMESLERVMPWYNSWHHPPMYLYLQTDPGIDKSSLQRQIQAIADAYQPESVKKENRRYFLQPLTDIHLHSSLYNEWEANSSIVYVKLFEGIGVFLILVACINFINLSTAQAAGRAREVGVRKVMGALRKQLIHQFLCEAFVITLISFVMALAIAEVLLMSLFRSILDREVSLDFLFQGANGFLLLGGLAALTLFAGIPPAFHLSRFQTVKTLKGQFEDSGSVLGLRKGLVLFQFLISACLIIGTAVVIRQVNLLRSKDLGFEKEQLVAIRMVDQYANENYEVLKQMLERDSRVIAAAVTSEIPGGKAFHGFEVNPEGFDEEALSMKTLGVDEEFLTTYGIRLSSGRNFSVESPHDADHGIILNEAAARFLGWTNEEAIGKRFELVVYTDGRVERKGRVIGVARDFHFESLYFKIEPLVLYVNKHPYYCDYLSVRFKDGDVRDNMQVVSHAWDAFHPEKPIECQFIDERLDNLYRSDVRMSSVLSLLAILSVFISCLGLFGLSSFAAKKRTKEIGIRKVLGASVNQIVGLLSREFVVLITWANVIAWPLAFFLSSRWLSHFPYRISPGVDIPLGTTMLTLMIALVTVGFQSLRAALANPVKSLRTE